jgi:pimeloyl-ACP methyl ester carboxylesterase
MPEPQVFHIPSPVAGLALQMFHQPAAASAGRRAVLYVHGATFPAALSIGFRFDGRSWADALSEAGFDVFGLDFLGFGGSGRYPEMAGPPDSAPPPGRAPEAAAQIGRAAAAIRSRLGVERVSLLAHSWGSLAAGLFAGEHPGRVDRLVLFGPIARREGLAAPAPPPAWRAVSNAAQWARFIADVPAGAAPVLSETHFAAWAPAYLASDPASAGREPPGVAVPGGPAADIADAWSGRLAYDPARIVAPVCILRGAWDSLCTDADAAWLFDACAATALKRDVKLSHGTHLMHLEAGREALYQAAITFLNSDSYIT